MVLPALVRSKRQSLSFYVIYSHNIIRIILELIHILDMASIDSPGLAAAQYCTTLRRGVRRPSDYREGGVHGLLVQVAVAVDVVMVEHVAVVEDEACIF